VLRYKDGQKYDAHWDQFDNPEIHKVPPLCGYWLHAGSGGVGEKPHTINRPRGPCLRRSLPCPPSPPAWVAVGGGAARGSDDETATYRAKAGLRL